MIEIKRWVSAEELSSLRDDVNNGEVISIGNEQFQYVGISHKIPVGESEHVTLQLIPYTNPEAFPNPLPDHFLFWPAGGKEFEHEVKKFNGGGWHTKTKSNTNWRPFPISLIDEYKNDWKYKGEIVEKQLDNRTKELIKKHEEAIKIRELTIEHYEKMIENVITEQKAAISKLKGDV
jgi:hypothetical protein